MSAGLKFEIHNKFFFVMNDLTASQGFFPENSIIFWFLILVKEKSEVYLIFFLLSNLFSLDLRGFLLCSRYSNFYLHLSGFWSLHSFCQTFFVFYFTDGFMLVSCCFLA